MATISPMLSGSSKIPFDTDAIKIQTFRKSNIFARFIDAKVQSDFASFMLRRAERQNYIIPMALLHVLGFMNIAKLCLFMGQFTIELSSPLFAISLLLSFFGLFLIICFSSLQLKNVQDFIGARKNLIRGAFVYGALICLISGNGLHLIGRTLVGECKPGMHSGFCNEFPGSPPVFQYTSLYMTIVYAFVICKGIIPHSLILFIWAICSCFITYDMYLEAPGMWVRTVGTMLSCAMMLIVLQVLLYQEMTMFEYHMALQTAMSTEIDQSQAEAEKEKTQLKLVLANVAHDLKTPLQAFSVSIHTLRDSLIATNISANLKSSFESIIRDMDASYAFMVMQINRALDVSRGDQLGGLIPSPEPFVLGETVSWVITIMACVQTRVNVKVTAHPIDLLERSVITDKVWFQENMLCLLSNAVKFSSGSSPVSIRCSLSKDISKDHKIHILFEVADEGVGIPEELQEKLFEPFSQGRRRMGGTGIGLYSLALRVQALGGTYGWKPQSMAGASGSIFYFSFPFQDVARRKKSSAQSSATTIISLMDFRSDEVLTLSHFGNRDKDSSTNVKSPKSEKSGRIKAFSPKARAADYLEIEEGGAPPTVLLVDDSALTLKVFERSISRTGVMVEKAVDGEMALMLMKKKLYTAVVMDIQMPVMDGPESVRRLRNWEASDDVDDRVHPQYIIGASACSRDETRRDAMGSGMNEFLLKPVDMNDIIMKIESLHIRNKRLLMDASDNV